MVDPIPSASDASDGPDAPRSGGRDVVDVLETGAVLAHYRIEREIGRGGQGVVFLAEDVRLRRRVALKVLTALGPGSESTVLRFRREAEVASRLDHPGICAVHDAGVADGLPYIAMSYVEGRTLAERLAEARATPTSAGPAPRLAPTEAVAIFERVARALHAAHEAGVVHRDVKPANIMTTSRGDPVVLDFGLARDDEADGRSLTLTGEFFGTPAYMSPEQLTGRSIRLDRRTDVYSLGVALFETLTLRRPFEAPTRQALFQAILTKEPPDVRRLNPAVSRDLKVVVDKALEKDRDRRYATAEEFAEDLRRVRLDEPVRARPVGPLGRLRRWARRDPAKAALLAAVLTALTVAAALFTAHVKERPEVERTRAAAIRAEQESLLADASWQLTEGGDPEFALRIYERALGSGLPCPDAAVGRVMAFLVMRRPEAALLEVDRCEAVYGTSHASALLRADAFAQLGRREDAARAAAVVPPPATALDHGLLAVRAMEEGERTGEPEPFRRAMNHAMFAALLSATPRLDFMVLRAHAAGHVRDAAAAEDAAAALRRHWPRSPSALFFAAFGLTESENPEVLPAAVEFLREAIRLAPGFAGARYSLANALARGGDRAGALAAARDAARLSPRDPETLAVLGRELSATGRYDEAAAVFEEALRLSPTCFQVLVTHGSLLAERGRPADAVECFRRALRERPRDADARARLGDALAESGRLEEGIAELRASLALSPAKPFALGRLGGALSAAGRFDEAIETIRSAISLDPKDAVMRANLGVVLGNVGRVEEAEEAWRDAAKLDPKFHEPLLYLGRSLVQRGRLAEGAAIFRDYVARRPDASVARFYLGNALRDLGRFAEAESAFREAVRLDPEQPEPSCNLGRMLGRRGAFAEAVAHLRRGHELGSRRPGWEYPSAAWVAEAEAALAERGEAEAELDRRLAEAATPAPPPSPERTARLAALLVDRGRAELALRWFEDAFARESSLQDDVASRRLFGAARAALALAATSADADVAARLRARARTWMTEDLDLLAEAEIDAADALLVRYAYESDPVFAATREAPADSRAASSPAAASEFAASWARLAAIAPAPR